VPTKHSYTSTSEHSVTSQKTIIFNMGPVFIDLIEIFNGQTHTHIDISFHENISLLRAQMASTNTAPQTRWS
jgi:hypothetical protein